MNFNPRSHKGSDLLQEREKGKDKISIHAPTRGATIPCFFLSQCKQISIHAPTRGATEMIENMFPNCGFQATLPQGERRGYSRDGYSRDMISIHAPTRGATTWLPNELLLFFISIHAPTRGATGGRPGASLAVCISIHAPTRGATLAKINNIITLEFQSTLPQGERLFLRAFDIKVPDFNPRSHKGSDDVIFPRKTKIKISIHAPTRGAT